jgi:hypothetical protein
MVAQGSSSFEIKSAEILDLETPNSICKNLPDLPQNIFVAFGTAINYLNKVKQNKTSLNVDIYS